jgi:hypothetical protein
MKELSQNLGSAFGRLINETMIPIVTKTLKIMDDRGLIDLPLKVNGLEIKVSAVAPLAMAQSMDDVQNIMQFAQIVQGAGPMAQNTLKVDAMMDLIAEKLGIPQKIRNSPEERQVAQQQAMQMAQQVAQQNPELAQNVATQAIKQGV